MQSGLLIGKPHRRSRYEATVHTQRELVFRASGLPTAINVGLNEVSLRLVGEREVEYSVSYRTWAAYVIGLGAVIGIGIVVAVLGWSAAAQDLYGLPGTLFQSNLGLALFWGMVAFWTVLWPWILIAAHRPFARKLLHRIIQEVDESPGRK